MDPTGSQTALSWEVLDAHALNWLSWRRTLLSMLCGPKNAEVWSPRRLFHHLHPVSNFHGNEWRTIFERGIQLSLIQPWLSTKRGSRWSWMCTQSATSCNHMSWLWWVSSVRTVFIRAKIRVIALIGILKLFCTVFSPLCRWCSSDIWFWFSLG